MKYGFGIFDETTWRKNYKLLLNGYLHHLDTMGNGLVNRTKTTTYSLLISNIFKHDSNGKPISKNLYINSIIKLIQEYRKT